MNRCRTLFGAAGLTLAWLAMHGAASAQVYRCESENGVPLFQNSSNGKNCRSLELPALMTIPAPKLPAPAATRAGATAAGAGATGAQAGSIQSGSGTATGSAAAPAAMRVDAATQKARDSDRRRIIEEELRKEEQKLADARREFNNGEPERRADERNYQKYLDRVEQMKAELARSEGNVTSLRRELGALRD